MSDYHRERGGHRQGGANADNLEALESDRSEFNSRGEASSRGNNRGDSGRGEQSRSRAAEGIPETLYRLRTPHSNETSYGYFNAPASGWPHFRTEAELEALLEGPIAQDSERSESSAAEDIPDLGPSFAEIGDQALSPEAAGASSEADAASAEETPADAAQVPAEDMAAEDAAAEAAAFAAAASREAFPAGPAAAPDTEAAVAAPAATVVAAAPAAPLIPARALVVAPTKYGRDVVEVQGLATDTAYLNQDEIVLIERPASIDDLRKLKENKE
ncbi:hypothetical protein LWX53_07745, partial [bacterium]|nr:hypothetical protein [bacterium]